MREYLTKFRIICILETAGEFQSVAAGENPSFDKRKDEFKESESVSLMGRLNLDIFSPTRLLIPGLRLSMTFDQAPNEFRRIIAETNRNEKIVIEMSFTCEMRFAGLVHIAGS